MSSHRKAYEHDATWDRPAGRSSVPVDESQTQQLGQNVQRLLDLMCELLAHDVDDVVPPERRGPDAI